MELCQKEGVAAGPTLNDLEIAVDPHMQTRGYYQKLNQAETGEHLYPGPLWRTSEGINPLRTPPPLLGEHNEYVYKELLGVTDEEYSVLQEQEHIGTEYLPGIQ